MVEPMAQTVLAFDYGRKNIGVAVGQTLTKTASALTVLRYGETRESKKVLQQQIQKLIAEWKPSQLIVGWPLNMDGTESELCFDVKKFASQLEKGTAIPIVFVDERLTSHEAKQQQMSRGEKNYRKQPIDSEAARIMLEGWLRENARA